MIRWSWSNCWFASISKKMFPHWVNFEDPWNFNIRCVSISKRAHVCYWVNLLGKQTCWCSSLEEAGRSPQSPCPVSALTLCDETGHSGAACSCFHDRKIRKWDKTEVKATKLEESHCYQIYSQWLRNSVDRWTTQKLGHQPARQAKSLQNLVVLGSSWPTGIW